MPTTQHVKIKDWSDFADDLRRRLIQSGFKRMIFIRNFPADRIDRALTTGTDRGADSPFWNETGFDYDHTSNPVGKKPDEITYVNRIKWQSDPFTVLNYGDEHTESYEDLTEMLDEATAVGVYDSKGLDRKAINEHWFNCDPRSVLLFVYSIEAEEAD